MAAQETGVQEKDQLFLPEWTQFTSKPLYNEWKARELQTCGNADEFAVEHGSATVIIVCGDPVAFPGNEAMIGMMTVILELSAVAHSTQRCERRLIVFLLAVVWGSFHVCLLGLLADHILQFRRCCAFACGPLPRMVSE